MGQTTKGMASPTLGDLAGFFLKLGTVAFGGPAAHIAMMEDEVVRRRGWVSAQEFLDLLAVSHLLPGPSSTELALFIGYRLHGIKGLVLVAGCFILPAFLMVSLLAWGYVRYGSLPAAQGLLYGVKPVVIAIVLQALWRLGKSALKSAALAAVGALALIASYAGASPLWVLLGAAVVALSLDAVGRYRSTDRLPGYSIPLLPLLASVPMIPKLLGIFLLFLKIGSIVFGSGYVLLAYLRADLVVHRHWLTESQLLDAVAVGQVTPGPVFTTATFIGYLLKGPAGAVVATAGIFAPALVFVALAGPMVHKLRKSKLARALLDNLNVASLALMAYVTYQLGRAAIVDWATLGLALFCAVLLLRWRVNATWLVGGGAVLGLLLTVFQTMHK